MVEDLVRELNDDLVFALSLGSKELFHTNLLGWFAEHQRCVDDTLLREWDPEAPPTSVTARREWRHLDLVLDEVKADGTPGPARVVVENKMFALPDLGQLREYGHVINRDLKGRPSLVLLSLADPGWTGSRWDNGTGNVWRHCSYQSLAGLLATTTLPQHTDRFQLATLEGWRVMVERLARLSELVCQPGPDECVFLPQTVSDKLRPIRLDAPVQRLRAHHVVSQLRKKLGDPLPADVSVDAGLTNGLGFVEAFVRVSDNIEAGCKFSPNFVYRYVQVPEITVTTAVSVGLDIVHRALSERDSPRWRSPR